MTEIPLWLHAVQFARPDQAVQQCSALTTVVRAEEQEVFAAQADRPQRIFSDIVISFRLDSYRQNGGWLYGWAIKNPSRWPGDGNYGRVIVEAFPFSITPARIV